MVAVEDNILNNGVISSMEVHVLKKLFLSFPDIDHIMLQPLNAWKNRNTTKDWSGPKLLAIWWIGMHLNNFAAPNSTQISFKGTFW